MAFDDDVKAKVGFILAFVYLDGVMDGTNAAGSKTYKGAAEKALEIDALYLSEIEKLREEVDALSGELMEACSYHD